MEDSWGFLIRVHNIPRIRLFNPFTDPSCPVPHAAILPDRWTTGRYRTGDWFKIHETWKNNPESHRTLAEIWTGQSVFAIDPTKMTSVGSHETHHTEEHPNGVVCEILLTEAEVKQCLRKSQHEQELFLASAAKRQRVEVKIKDLTPEEIIQFEKAKDKELSQWLATDTVRRVLRHKIPEGQLLRSRWVLTWKPLDDIEAASTGLGRKAKARLVILGLFEDPAIDSLPRDSPTLGKDTRMLALQVISSHRWEVRSFDISTAFLRGSRQDSRVLGVEPPPELRQRLNLKDDETLVHTDW